MFIGEGQQVAQPRGTDMVVVGLLRLREQVRAMRHLRPGNHLPQPRGPLSRQVRDGLLPLSDDRDPLQWLSEERGDVAALLTLCLALDLSIALRRGAQHLARLRGDLGVPSGAGLQSGSTPIGNDLFGRLLTTGEASPASASWAEDIASLNASAAPLGALRRLRRECDIPPEDSPRVSATAPGRRALLADLLRLPDAIDPLRWLRDERGELSARLALEHVVRQLLPPPGTVVAVGTPRKPAIRSRTQHPMGPALSIQVDDLEAYELGFALHLQARYRAASPQPPDPRLDAYIAWDGFDRVVDDLGHHYLVQVTDRQIGKRPWRQEWHERLTLVCCPALGNARELVLQSLPAALAPYYASPVGDELIPMPSPSLGPVSMHIELVS